MTKLRQVKNKAAKEGKRLTVNYALKDTMLTIGYGDVLYHADMREGENKLMMTERLCVEILKSK